MAIFWWWPYEQSSLSQDALSQTGKVVCQNWRYCVFRRRRRMHQQQHRITSKLWNIYFCTHCDFVRFRAEHFFGTMWIKTVNFGSLNFYLFARFTKLFSFSIVISGDFLEPFVSRVVFKRRFSTSFSKSEMSKRLAITRLQMHTITRELWANYKAMP